MENEPSKEQLQASGHHQRQIPELSLFDHLSFLKQFHRNRLDALLGLAERYPDWVRCQIFGKRYLIINSPWIAKRILRGDAHEFQRNPETEYLREFLGPTLLSSSLEQRAELRGLYGKAFDPNRINLALLGMGIEVNSTVEGWKDWLRRSPRQTSNPASFEIDLRSELQGLTIQAISRALFGFRVGLDLLELSQALSDVMEWFAYRSSPLAQKIQFLPSARKNRFRNARKVIEKSLQTLILDRYDKESASGSPHSLSSLVDLFFTHPHPVSGQPFSADQVRDQVVSIYLSSIETVSQLIPLALAELHFEEKWFEKIRKESELIVDRPFERKEVCQLRQTRSVIDETLRLYPSTWMIGRSVQKEVEIQECLLQKGETLLISPFVIHRSPSFWAHPESFDPSREHRDNPAYFPFGEGEYACVGKQLALDLMTLVLSAVCENFSVQWMNPVRKVQLQPWAFLRSKEPLRFRFCEKLQSKELEKSRRHSVELRSGGQIYTATKNVESF